MDRAQLLQLEQASVDIMVNDFLTQQRFSRKLSSLFFIFFLL